MRDAALLALIGLYSVGVLLADLTIWPGRAPTILLALPILVAALCKSPQFVIGAALVAIGIDALDIFKEHLPLALCGVTFFALVGISFVATLIALRRQQEVERSQQQEAMIRMVEGLRQPLTVIMGYTQILRARPDLPDGVALPLKKIDTAARHLGQQIDRVLADHTSSPN